MKIYPAVRCLNRPFDDQWQDLIPLVDNPFVWFGLGGIV